MSLFEENIEAAKNPKWDDTGNDWQLYVCAEVRGQWESMGVEARCILIDMAKRCLSIDPWAGF